MAYNETITLISWLDIIRALIALAAKNKWHIYQLDVKSAYLNGYLEGEIYVEQLLGFKISVDEKKTLKLKKA